MIEQLLLPGVEPSWAPTDRLLLMLMPPPEVAERVDALTARLRTQLGLKPRRSRERLHVTLCPLGDYDGLPAPVVAAAGQAATEVAAAPFDVTFDRMTSFRGGQAHPLVLLAGAGNDAIVALRRRLAESLRAAGVPFPSRSAITPHMTLLRSPRSLPETPVEPVSWTVRDVVLVHSLLGQSKYVELGRWALQ
ncbi:2'-5' RNA ligase family protein [Paraburkholderia phosphatilytica]|uniref:2'-5' RNA ligase family protein n=1 Tax=Paraburkholderia phosphatilytica TaxID=2282883 RepID=UPI0013E0A6B8|nr:2'-5' RNA ligase family protein [Paraburkholderia phosphatilytica]